MALAYSDCADPQYRLHCPPLLGIRQGRIDVIERIVPDESIEGEPPFRVQCDQFGNKDLGIGIPFNDAAHQRPPSMIEAASKLSSSPGAPAPTRPNMPRRPSASAAARMTPGRAVLSMA